ncbi:MAG: hypothetical protein P8Y66_04630 [Nitrospirota bacterium]
MRRHSWTSLVLILLGTLVLTSTAGAGQRDYLLKRGLRNDEPRSAYLVRQAEKAEGKKREALLEQALAYSPDVPALYFKAAWGRLPDFAGSMAAATEGLKAYARSFYWTESLVGLTLASVGGALFLALLLALLFRLPLDVPLLAHDINERKGKILLPLACLSLALLGPVFFMAGGFFLVSLYARKSSKTAFFLVALVLMASPLIVQVGNTFLSTSSPELQAVVAVNEGRDNSPALEALAGKEDFASRFSYALALKREGLPRDSIRIYTGLIENRGEDPRLYVNLGNAYVAAGYMDHAEQSYQNALRLGRSVTALYNLSQVHRHQLDFEEGDKYYDQAFTLDAAAVSRFTAIAGKDPERLVVDETLSTRELWMKALRDRRDMIRLSPLRPLPASLAGAVLLVLFLMVDKVSSSRAFRCTRCGAIACRRCAGGRQWEQICGQCQKVESGQEQGPRARVTMMLSSGEYKYRLLDRVRLLSFAPPGFAQLYSGRVMSGIVFLWLFLFPVLFLAADPLLATGLGGFSHSWLLLPALLLAVLLYAVSFISVNRRIDRGWL